MKKTILCFCVALFIFCSNLSFAYASNIKNENLTGVYLSDKIILSNGNEVDLKENDILLFINGSLLVDCKY